MTSSRADLNSEAICKACHQVVFTKTGSNVASESTAVVSKRTVFEIRDGLSELVDLQGVPLVPQAR